MFKIIIHFFRPGIELYFILIYPSTDTNCMFTHVLNAKPCGHKNKADFDLGLQELSFSL